MKVKIIFQDDKEIISDNITSIEPEIEQPNNKVIGLTLNTKDGCFYYSKANIKKVIVLDV